MFPIKALLLSNPVLREAKPDEDLEAFFFHFQTVFKSTVTISVSTNPLNVIHFFIFRVFLGERSGILLCDTAGLSVRTNSSKGGWMD